MPTFLLMNGETPLDKIVGANPDELRKRMDQLIPQNPSDA